MSNAAMDNTSQTIPNDKRLEAQFFARMMRAFTEASDEVQDVVRSIIEVINDPDTDTDEYCAALDTLADALWPACYNGELGIDLTDLRFENEQNGVATDDFAEFDRHDAEFASNLKALMQKKGITQTELAERINVGQPAISMMLNRACHPQRRTVARIAKALDVTPNQLWPGFEDDNQA